MKLGKAALLLRQFREGVKYLNEAEDILKFALGPKHKLVDEEIPKLLLLANEDIEILIERRIAAHKEKEEQERKKQEEANFFSNLFSKVQMKQKPIWETDRALFQKEKEWQSHLAS